LSWSSLIIAQISSVTACHSSGTARFNSCKEFLTTSISEIGIPVVTNHDAM
jgi:hypothetical protein